MFIKRWKSLVIILFLVAVIVGYIARVLYVEERARSIMIRGIKFASPSPTPRHLRDGSQS